MTGHGYTQPMQRLFDDTASGFSAYTEALRRHGGIRRFFDDTASAHAAQGCTANGHPNLELFNDGKSLPKDAQPMGRPIHSSSMTRVVGKRSPRMHGKRPSHPWLFNDSASVNAAYAEALRRHGVGIRSSSTDRCRDLRRHGVGIRKAGGPLMSLAVTGSPH
ncbi:hypothetical protein BC629DRAFT_1731497 [Irpex lacteus]|nr:hypothetical protein BC629DRAFT_1731497 [Irpex lacteus]